MPENSSEKKMKVQNTGLSEEDLKNENPWFVLITVMVGTMLIGLDRTVVNLAVPKIIQTFSLTVAAAGWVATAYIISNAVFVPVFGKLGDLYGNRRIYYLAFIGFIILSVLAGLAWNYTALVVFRALQGLVGAAVYPTAMSLIAKHFRDPGKRAQALGIWSSSFAVSAVIGPLIGGYLIDNFSWRAIFYINLPIGIVGLLMVIFLLRDDRPQKRRAAFDYYGSVLLSIAITSLTLVLEKGVDWGWGSGKAVIAYLIAIGFGLWFYRHENHQEDPIIDFKFFKNPTFSSAIGASFIVFGGMMGAMFLLPVFAQNILGFDAVKTGLLFMPMAFTMLFAAPIGARMSTKMHIRIPVMIGITVASLGMFLIGSKLDVAMTELDIALPLVVFAVGMGFVMAPLTNSVTSSVPREEVGTASGIFSLIRNIAGAFGIAIFSTLLSNFRDSSILSTFYNSAVSTQTPVLTIIGDALIYMKAQVTSFQHVFFVASALLAIGLLTGFFIKDFKDKDNKNYEGNEKSKDKSDKKSTEPVIIPE